MLDQNFLNIKKKEHINILLELLNICLLKK